MHFQLAEHFMAIASCLNVFEMELEVVAFLFVGEDALHASEGSESLA